MLFPAHGRPRLTTLCRAAQLSKSENRIELKIELLRAETKQMEVTLKKDIELLRAETRQSIAETKAELVRWLVAVGILQSTLVVGVLLKVAHLI
jgi:hypothetical protein